MVDKMQDITSELRKANQTLAVPQMPIGGVAPEEVENYTGSGVGEELEKMLDPGELPKGLNRVTLKWMCKFIEENDDGVTVSQVAEGASLSKVTIRRYFDYLEQCGLVEMEQRYGLVGSPLRIYWLKKSF